MNDLLYLDCSSGISGDMTVAALLDLGADEKVLREALDSLPLEGFRIEISRVKKSGIDACDFHVILDEDHENHDHDMGYLHGFSSQTHSHDAHEQEQHDPSHDASGGHGHHDPSHDASGGHGHHDHSLDASGGHDHHDPSHDASGGHDHHDHSHDASGGHDHEPHGHAHHHGRGMDEITTILYSGLLTDRALALALRIFEIVAEAESKVHGIPADQVHFHEVGAVDSIVDIAAVAVCIDNLGIEKTVIPFLTEGTGRIRCQHGLLPVPVPATSAIAAMYHLPLQIIPVQGELVTPTGAAIAAALRTGEELPKRFTISRIGMGAGKRKYETAGILRAMLLKEEPAEMNPAEADPDILKLETNLDDCSPEALGFVMEQLFNAGALDVYYTPVYMKKNRPGTLLSVICSNTPEDLHAMETIIFRHTTGIGIRRQVMQRTRLPREEQVVATPLGDARVKICSCGGEVYCYPEHESVAALAVENDLGYPEVYQLIKTFAIRRLLS